MYNGPIMYVIYEVFAKNPVIYLFSQIGNSEIRLKTFSLFLTFMIYFTTNVRQYSSIHDIAIFIRLCCTCEWVCVHTHYKCNIMQFYFTTILLHVWFVCGKIGLTREKYVEKYERSVVKNKRTITFNCNRFLKSAINLILGMVCTFNSKKVFLKFHEWKQR